MHPARYCLFVLVAATVAQPVGAQAVAGDTAFVPGQRARVSYHRLRRPLIGEFVSSDSLALVIRKPGVRQPYYITWDKVARLEESIDQYSRGETVVRATAAGFLAGVALGTGLTASHLLITGFNGEPEFGISDVAIHGLVITTIGGAILGITWPRDHWQHVPLQGDPPRLTIHPLRDGRLGLGLSFGD